MDRDTWDQLVDSIEMAVVTLTRMLRRDGRSPSWNGDHDEQLVRQLRSNIECYWDDVLKREQARRDNNLADKGQELTF